MNNDWKIKINENFGGMMVLVFIYRENGSEIEIAYFEQDGTMSIKKYSPIEENPTFKIPIYVWESLKESLVTKHERDKSTVEAELGATKFHLEDMRKLVFKGKLLK